MYANLMHKNINYFHEKHASVAQLVHKLSNDISLISQTLSLDIIFGLRGFLFVVGKLFSTQYNFSLPTFFLSKFIYLR
jgi:hypothetical protein